MNDIKEKDWVNFIIGVEECHEIAMKLLCKRLCKLEEEVEELKRGMADF